LHPKALLQRTDGQSSGRKTWKYSSYPQRFACMDAGKGREQERKLCASHLTVSGTCPFNQDLFCGSLTKPSAYKKHHPDVFFLCQSVKMRIK
jgi:hypothetical protein